MPGISGAHEAAASDKPRVRDMLIAHPLPLF